MDDIFEESELVSVRKLKNQSFQGVSFDKSSGQVLLKPFF
jgi:hypothetical protein